MIRFLMVLAAFAALAAPGSQTARAQALADTTRAAAPARRASAAPDSVAAPDTGAAAARPVDSTAVRLIPVKILSPGGVRIRSVRDNRRIVVVAPPARVAPASATTPAPTPTPAPATGVTREDLDRLEARLREYFDARTRDLALARRDTIVSLSAGPRGPAGATQVVIVPVPTPSPAAPDSAIADTLAALRDSLATDPARRAAVARDSAAPDTAASGSVEAPFLGMKAPTITLLAPGASSAEVERAVLEGELLRAVNIIFEFNSAALLPASLSILNSLGGVLAKHPDLRLEIGGHTDSSGPAEYNLRLSQARAEAVRDYLVTAFSIARGRLPARGFGESMPVADEATPTGRALNRRVEFLVLRPGARPEAAPSRPEDKRP